MMNFALNVLFILVFSGSAFSAQVYKFIPQFGNGLLEYCKHKNEARDSKIKLVEDGKDVYVKVRVCHEDGFLAYSIPLHLPAGLKKDPLSAKLQPIETPVKLDPFAFIPGLYKGKNGWQRFELVRLERKENYAVYKIEWLSQDRKQFFGPVYLKFIGLEQAKKIEGFVMGAHFPVTDFGYNQVLAMMFKVDIKARIQSIFEQDE